MKTIFHCISLAIVVLLCSQTSFAQHGVPIYGAPNGGAINGAASYGGNMAPASADIFNLAPGRMWVEFNLADQGLGYSGSYFTLGGKARLFEDFLDGRWLAEGQGHISLDSGGFFGNFGIMRTMTLQSAGADITGGIWLDGDGDEQGTFAHTFTQWSLNGQVKTDRWDLYLNGYLPFATTDYSEGDVSGRGFYRNLILIQNGIDSALRGYDANLRFRAPRMGMFAGWVELGFYSYQSDLVNQFLGGRVGGGTQFLKGGQISAFLTHDERFNTTGLIQLSWWMGLNARGSEYAGLGRDLEPTVRNDHIVRYQRDLLAVIDPDTGIAYNVLHVDNTAGPGGDGTFENPYNTTAAAEGASIADDIVFVWEGDGTTTGYDTGFVMKDRQFLLGDGVEHLVPTIGGLFRLPNSIDGMLPSITGPVHAVTLANSNTVRGFNIVNGGTTVNGIHTSGPTITDGTLEDLNINALGNDGIHLEDIAGDWRIARVTATNNGNDGIHIEDACDPTSVFDFEDLNLNFNIGHGLHMINYDGTLRFANVTANNNVLNGIFLEGFKGGGGAGNILFTDLVLRNNGINGVFVDDFTGDISFLDNDITGNTGGAGIRLLNVKNPVGTRTLIGSTSILATNQVLLNQTNIDILLNEAGARQETLITDTQIGGVFNPLIPAVFLAGSGVRADANGAGITMITDVINNRGIQYNAGAGVFIRSRGGASHTANVFNDVIALNMDGNGTGIVLQVGDLVPTSTLTSFVDNITMNATVDGAGNILRNGAGTVVSGISTANGVLNSVVQNIQADTIGNGITFSANNLNNNIAPTAANINTLFNRDLTFTTIRGSGASLVTGDGTYTDFDLVGTNTFLADTVIPAGAQGVSVVASGDAGGDPLDNRTRVNIAGTTITNFLGAGMTITGNEDAQLLIGLQGNTVAGVGAGIVNTALPFFDGIRITSNDNSTVNAELIGNQVANSFDQGIQFDVTGANGTMNIVLDSNTSFGNDFGEDAANDPIVDATFIDILGQNLGGATASLCVAMTGNAFGNTTLQNGSVLPPIAEGTAVFENGGNGGVIIELGTFTPAAYGTVCQPAIDDQTEAGGVFENF